MDFEWDEEKADANLGKHGVDFEEAALVFLDSNRIEAEDLREDYGEARFRVIGRAAGRVLFVVYTEREGRIRLISARKATRSERRAYEDAFGPEETQEGRNGLGSR